MSRETHEIKTVVSVTPTKIQADSRSFKIAASLTRFGYTSIVVEANKSDLDRRSLPFELRTIPRPVTRRMTASSSGSTQPSAPHWTLAVKEAWNQVRAKLSFLSMILFLIRYVQRYVLVPLRCIPKASLYYLHGIALFPPVYLLCRRHRVPFIYDAHDFYSGMYSQTEMKRLPFQEKWVAVFYKYVESQIIKNASAVVTVSDGVAELLRKTFDCKPIVVRNCHDRRLDREPSRNLRQALGLSSDEFVLVAVGNAKEGMAIREALDAMLRLPDSVHLAFLGAFFESYVELVRDRALSNRVHILPPVNPYEVVPFIRAADASIILYYPRSADYAISLPNRFFQPIAAELPLLYPELHEIKRIAEKHHVGIPIDPQVPESISDAVAQLISNPTLLAAFKKNLRAASDELSWENEESILRGLISAALELDPKHAERAEISFDR